MGMSRSWGSKNSICLEVWHCVFQVYYIVLTDSHFSKRWLNHQPDQSLTHLLPTYLFTTVYTYIYTHEEIITRSLPNFLPVYYSFITNWSTHLSTISYQFIANFIKWAFHHSFILGRPNKTWCNFDVGFITKLLSPASPEAVAMMLSDEIRDPVSAHTDCFQGGYPLVICYSLPWKITIYKNGKPSISMGNFQ
jgi:hypothetical protein